MVAWDGESDLGGIRFRRSSIPLLLGAVAVTAGWTAVWAVSDHPAQLPATGVDRRDATYGPLALPWQGAATAGQWRSIGPAGTSAGMATLDSPSARSTGAPPGTVWLSTLTRTE